MTEEKQSSNSKSVAEKISDSKFAKVLNKFDGNIKVGAQPLDWIRHGNDQLESVPATITEWFDTIFNSGEKFSQKGVDMICEYGAWAANITVEKIRQSIIKSLYEQYGFMFAIQKKIMVVKNFFTNPLSILGAVASAVKSILNLFLGPIAYVIAYIINVVKEVIRFGENMANIAKVLPPQPPNPSINFNAFKLQLGKMGVSILTDDPSQLPSPSEMFPEPIRPLTPEFWQALNSTTSSDKTYRESKAFYNLPSKDFEKNMAEKFFEEKYSSRSLSE